MSILFTSRLGNTGRRQVRGFAWMAAGLVVCFGSVLLHLGEFALRTEFNSYLLLIPAIAAGMVWVRGTRSVACSEPNRALALMLLAAGITVLVYFWLVSKADGASTATHLTLPTFSFVLLFAGIAAWCLGSQTLKRVGFPLCFLICMVPLPASLTANLETLLQHSSAALANVGFQASDLPVFRRSDLEFQLPGITLEVSPECSGIQSTVALFVVSMAAGFVFLRSPWKRTLLSLAVLPLGVLRNAIRIITIGELCVHVGPDMINSYIHRKGGWIFFLVALLPFLALLLVFVQSEIPRSKH